MPLLRGRRDESGGTRYQMREKVLAIGDDFWVENQDGERAFKVDGRPITAIQNADIDGNPATTADPTWTPLVTTPNHPEYPSQHGCVTSALAQVLANAAGSPNFNATIWGAAGGATTLTTTRTYPAVQDLLTELVNARVWIGFHFRNSVIAGENLGTAVANWELRRFFLPTDDEGED